MGLAESLLQRPRESSGSRSSNRFDFQKDWALCHLLQVHESGNDYVLVFEHHDDLIVLDCEMAPTLVDFFQVKTRDSGSWSVQTLLHRTKGQKDPSFSILGKLYDNRLRFADRRGRLVWSATQTISSPLQRVVVAKTAITPVSWTYAKSILI